MTSTFSTFKEYGSFLLHRRKPRRFSIYLKQLCYLLGFVQPYSVPDQLRRYGGRQRPRVRLTSTQKEVFCRCCFLIYLSPIVPVAVHQITSRIYQGHVCLLTDAKKSNLAESRVKFSRYADARSFVLGRIRCLTRSKIRMNIQQR